MTVSGVVVVLQQGLGPNSGQLLHPGTASQGYDMVTACVCGVVEGKVGLPFQLGGIKGGNLRQSPWHEDGVV
jgi:hypothetical protein